MITKEQRIRLMVLADALTRRIQDKEEKMSKDEIKKLEKEREALAQENRKIYAEAFYLGRWIDAEAQKRWYENSAKITENIKREGELARERAEAKMEEERPSVNGYGEKTSRYITSQTYERAMKRQEKQIQNWMKNR